VALSVVSKNRNVIGMPVRNIFYANPIYFLIKFRSSHSSQGSLFFPITIILMNLFCTSCSWVVVLCAGVPEAGVLPELRRFFTSRSRSCCAFFPAPAGKLELLILRLWSYCRKICNTIGHILDIACCNMIMFCKIVTKYLFLLANFGPWSETVL
jgi:hypothetical protein